MAVVGLGGVMGMRERCIDRAAAALASSALAEGAPDRHIALLATEAAQTALDAILGELMQPDIEMLNASLRMTLEDQEMPHIVFEAMLSTVQGKEKQ